MSIAIRPRKRHLHGLKTVKTTHTIPRRASSFFLETHGFGYTSRGGTWTTTFRSPPFRGYEIFIMTINDSIFIWLANPSLWLGCWLRDPQAALGRFCRADRDVLVGDIDPRR